MDTTTATPRTDDERAAYNRGRDTARMMVRQGTDPDDIRYEAQCPAYGDRALVECWWDGFHDAADHMAEETHAEGV